MPTTLAPVLLNAPMVDPRTGRVSRPWLAWFEQSYLRQGGQEAATNTELAGGVQDNSDHIGQVEEGLGSTNTTLASLDAEVTQLQEAYLVTVQELEALTVRVEALETNLTALTDRVTTLETTVTEQETRLAALEAWKTAMVAALPATVTVTPLPTLTDAPATADALRDNLTAAWQGPVNTNNSGLATAVNAVREALAA